MIGRLDAIAQQLGEHTAARILKRWAFGEDLETLLTEAERKAVVLRGGMIRLQEDLDWECYRLYCLTGDDLVDPHWETRDLPVRLGERAFEIVLAHKIRDGGLHTTWFERHRSTPITDLPAHWPADYRELVERRIAAIEANPQIALIEQPEYERRWNDTPWKDKVQDALHAWLLDRLESYFDLDGRMNSSWRQVSQLADCSTPGPIGKLETCRHEEAQIDVSLLSTAKIADLAGRDPAFQTVADTSRSRRAAATTRGWCRCSRA
jgi:hypothetical protein